MLLYVWVFFVFFMGEVKYLQKSSEIQNISINFVLSAGADVFRILLIIHDKKIWRIFPFRNF
mgnify:FL=1